MSLTGALNTSFAGLQNTEAKLNVTSSNVSNADKTGYTRKSYETEYTTTSSGTVPTGGSVQSAIVDPYLQKTVIEDTSAAAKDSVTAEYLSEYVDRLGSVGGDNTLSAAVDDLSVSLEQLAVTPEQASLKTQVVSDAEKIVQELHDLSNTVQDARSQADQQIEDAVATANQTLQQLESLNAQIAAAQSSGRSTADLEDERFTMLETLAEQIDIDYFIDGNNQLKIYTSGRVLLDSRASELSYTAASSVSSSVEYPGGFSGITLNGSDITEDISGGAIGGLVELRDTILVQEQQKLDEFAAVLIDTINTVYNQGTAIPASAITKGETTGINGTDAISASGTLRLGLADDAGTIIEFFDFDLSSYADIDALITDINTSFAGTLTASLSPSGELVFTSTDTSAGVIITDDASAFSPSGQSFNAYFGIKTNDDFFTGTSAASIQIGDALDNSAHNLVTGSFTFDINTQIGDNAVYSGDGTIASALSDIFTSTQNFDAAGNFNSQNKTLSGYAANIISDVASRASNAADAADATAYLMDQTKTALQNLTGVNIDEEMAYIIELESKYDAAATLISTLQDMFDELIAAVR